MQVTVLLHAHTHRNTIIEPHSRIKFDEVRTDRYPHIVIESLSAACRVARQVSPEKYFPQNAGRHTRIRNIRVQDQAMSRRSKGDRVVTTVRLMLPVWEYCRAEARARRVPIITYVADVMAAHAGRADLIRDLTDAEELLPLAL